MGETRTIGNRIFLGGEQVFMVSVPANRYPRMMDELMEAVAKHRKKTCYVSLDKPHSTVEMIFKRHGVDPGKFFIVDASSSATEVMEKKDNVNFVARPNTMTELNRKIGAVHRKRKFDLVLLDSISTLLTYKEAEILEFLLTLISRFRASKAQMVFLVSDEDKDSSIVKNLSMFVDAVVDL
jgi:KaiC/GvpD/RAD55 family RecA-like ATPase